MGDPASFEDLPVETVNAVVEELELLDICNLRLASKALAAKAVYGFFKKAFQSCAVNLLETERLESLATVTGSHYGNGIAFRLQEVHLLGQNLAYEAKYQLRASRQHSTATTAAPRLLSKSFANIVEAQEQQQPLKDEETHLKYLTLNIRDKRKIHPRNFSENGNRPYRGDFKSVWAGASHAFKSLATALEESKLRLHALNLFNLDGCEGHQRSDHLPRKPQDFDWLYKGERCEQALAVDSLLETLQNHDLTTSFGNLRRLSFRISDGVGVFPKERHAPKNSNGSGLRRLLSLCPRLEALHLRWFDIHNGWAWHNMNEAIRQSNFILTAISEAHLPALSSLALGGIECDTEALLGVVKAHNQLKSLDMEEITLAHGGGFMPFFHHVTSEMARLEEYKFHNFYVPQQVCFDDPPGRRYLPGRNYGPPTLCRKGEDVHMSIGYRRRLTRLPRDPERYRVLDAAKRLYGPPS